MRSGAAFLFIGLFALIAFKDALLVGGFYANRDRIAGEFCVNIDAPEAMCYGKCFLVDTFEAEKQRDREIPALDISEKQVVCTDEFVRYTVHRPTSSVLRVKVDRTELPFRLFASEIFRPPRSV